MVKNKGYTLIELLVFIIVISIASSIIAYTIAFTLKYTPIEHNQTIATNTASSCMEHLLGQRYLNGFTFNTQDCPGGSDDDTTPPFCSNITPTGFTTSVTIKCTTVPDFIEQKFKFVEVKTTGPASEAAILKMLLSDYEYETSAP